MTAPFDVRKIDVNFQIGSGTFGETGSNAIKISGLRVAVQVETAALPNTGLAVIRVYGLTLDQMNQISVAGLVWEGRNNKVALQAGDSSGMTTIFNGNIIEAAPEFEESESFISITASSSNEMQLKPIEPSSFPGPTKASDAIGQIAKKAGVSIEDNGVKAVLASPYYPGTAWSQLNSCVEAADCFAVLDGVNNKLAIWPKGSNRGGDVPEVSAATGMIGYPKFQQTQIKVRTVFDPSLLTGIGQQIKVVSDLTAANGTWNVVMIDHVLESENPGGPWETLILASPVKAK